MKKLTYFTALACLFSMPLSNAQTIEFINSTYNYGTMPNNVGANDVATAYTDWKTNFLASCPNGRYRVQFDNPSETVSEGIAYGMLLTAYANDQAAFDGLWLYYQDHVNANGVMNWKINGCSTVVGFNGATDAEIDAAIALMVAELRWGNAGSINYGAAASSLITIIKNHEVEAGTFVLKPGDAWGGSNTTNPSYFTPGYFRAYGDYMSDNAYWNNVASKTYEIIDNNLTQNSAVHNLVSDWTRADGNYTSEVAGWAAHQGQAYFYDAARTPWRIATDYLWYGDADALSYTTKCDAFVNSVGGFDQIYPGYNQDGSTITTAYKDVTFTGAYAVAAMASGNQTFVNQAYTEVKNMTTTAYFGATLRVLYMYAMTGNTFNPTQTNVLSTESTDPNITFLIYPNPVSEQLNIRFISSDEREIRIHDFTGKIIAHKKTSRDEELIDVQGLSAGIYFAKIENQVVKFIKE
ncbi:glycosyl hydrolase family 8 [Sungkyunkwania multivorans]|uniref:cellulase n=1 Tax=Sungkyunkwania multivorans TaxID=1173618 RepID=A0ABW3CX52_9FLAO